jgi:hypothetical protein
VGWVRVALVVFVVSWLFDVAWLRSVVPIWLPFVVALALELEFFLSARGSPPPARSRGRAPQQVDLEQLGYTGGAGAGELLLVRDGERELWIPYAGETGEELEELVAEARLREELPPGPPAAPERRRPGGLLAGLALIAALGALVWYVDHRTGWNGLGEAPRSETTARLSAEATRIVGRPVEIRCDEMGGYVGAVQHADGVAEIGGRVAYLTPERCFDLYRLAFRGETSFSQTGRAIAVLAHESWHLRGERDEARTECFALQTGVGLGVRLGLSEGTARQMMRQQLAENALHAGASPEYLLTAGCRDGGELDLNPGTSRFP